MERWRQWQGVRPTAEWLSERDAARWLLANDHELPDDLAHFEEEICEWAAATRDVVDTCALREQVLTQYRALCNNHSGRCSRAPGRS